MNASVPHIAALLRACDAGFVPPLSSRVDIDAYAAKLAAHARLLAAWEDGELAGLVALYCNDLAGRTAFVTSVSVAPQHTRRGIADRLLRQAIELARAAGMRDAALEVDGANLPAIALYLKHGFAPAGQATGGTLYMRLRLTDQDHP